MKKYLTPKNIAIVLIVIALLYLLYKKFAKKAESGYNSDLLILGDSGYNSDLLLLGDKESGYKVVAMGPPICPPDKIWVESLRACVPKEEIKQ